MRTKTFTTVMILALVAFFTDVSATVWRVNPTPNSSAQYSTVQAAHDAATTVNFDTLYLEGSTFSFGGLTLTKKLTIIGNGYFLAENPQTQYNIQPSTFNGYVYCYAGCEGSKFIGCSFVSSVYIYTNNITFERNYFNTSYSIYPQTNCSDILILNNYFNYAHYNLYFNQVHSNILVANNYFAGYVTASSSFSGVFANNIFSYPLSAYNSTLVNNIALSSVDLYNCIKTYNIGNSTQFGNLDGNQQNVGFL